MNVEREASYHLNMQSNHLKYAHIGSDCQSDNILADSTCTLPCLVSKLTASSNNIPVKQMPLTAASKILHTTKTTYYTVHIARKSHMPYCHSPV